MTAPAGLTVLAGPTAVGKGTVVAALRARHPEVMISVSVTTRRPRPGEQAGREYHFVDDRQFDRLVESGALLEWARVHAAARYGTPREPVEQAVAAGLAVLLEIDLQGARQVRESAPDARFVFLAPPDFSTLVTRLVGRGTEDPADRERRLASAREELAARSWFDHVVVNDEVARAAGELAGLMGLHHAEGQPDPVPARTGPPDPGRPDSGPV